MTTLNSLQPQALVTYLHSIYNHYQLAKYMVGFAANQVTLDQRRSGVHQDSHLRYSAEGGEQMVGSLSLFI